MFIFESIKMIMMNNDEQLDEVLLDDAHGLSKNERIGFWMRFGAYMIDFLCTMIFGTIIGLAIGDQLAPVLFGKQMAEIDQISGQLGGQFSVFFEKIIQISSGTTITVLIWFVMEAAFGQSPGKMILKIRNTNVDGTRALPKTLWLRSLLKYGATILSILGGVIGIQAIGYLGSLWSLVIFVGFFFAFGDNRQTIHDMIAKTVVSKVPKKIN